VDVFLYGGTYMRPIYLVFLSIKTILAFSYSSFRSSLPPETRRESHINRRSEYDNMQLQTLTPQSIAEFAESSKIPDIDESDITTDDNRSPASSNRSALTKKNSSFSNGTSSSEDFDNSLTIDGSNEDLNSSADTANRPISRQRLQKS